MLKRTLLAFAVGMLVLGATTTAYAEATPTRTGYDFDGWSDSNGEQLQQNSKIEVLKDHTITAKWIPHPYTIHFERGQIKGSSGSLSGSTGDQNMIYDVEKALNANGYKQNGYTFQHWKGSDGKTYSNLQKVKNLTSEKNGKVTLTGQWKANTNTRYIVQHYQQAINGSYPSSPSKTDTLYGTTDTTVTPATAAFSGFTVPSKGTVKINGDGTSSIRYNYTRNSYTATFNVNGGSGSNSNITRKYDEALGTLPNPTRAATAQYTYTFDGWYTASSGGTKISNTTKMPASNVTYYAHWTPVTRSYTVTVNKGVGISSVTGGGTYKYGQSVTVTGTANTGYHNPIRETFTVTGAVTKTITAQINTYTVRFNANGGTGSMSDLAMTYGVAKNLPNNAFTRAGYTFKGWSTSATSDIADYTNGASVKNLTSTNGGVVNLYAVWKRKSDGTTNVMVCYSSIDSMYIPEAYFPILRANSAGAVLNFNTNYIKKSEGIALLFTDGPLQQSHIVPFSVYGNSRGMSYISYAGVALGEHYKFGFLEPGMVDTLNGTTLHLFSKPMTDIPTNMLYANLSYDSNEFNNRRDGILHYLMNSFKVDEDTLTAMYGNWDNFKSTNSIKEEMKARADSSRLTKVKDINIKYTVKLDCFEAITTLHDKYDNEQAYYYSLKMKGSVTISDASHPEYSVTRQFDINW